MDQNKKNILLVGYKKKKIVILLFCLAVIFKQFYILPSGSFQLGDFFFMLFVFCSFSFFHIHLKKIDLFLLLFVILASIINFIAYAAAGFTHPKYAQSAFITNLFYIYNFLIVIAFRFAFNDDESLYKLAYALKTGLVFQLLIFISGLGRWYTSVRYMGTFNDPNQYGFYILTAFFIIYNIDLALKKSDKRRYIWLVIAVYLIIQSSSTGMLLGLFGFAGFNALLYLYRILPRSIFRSIVVVFVLLIVILFYLLFYSGINFDGLNIGNAAIKRLLEKIDEFSDGFVLSFAKDRNMTRVINHPEILIFGSGEGFGSAFGINFNESGDIHSDFFSLLFSYGIIPFALICLWIIQNMRGISPTFLSIYFGLLAESLTLVNHRQPLFWCIWVMASFEVFRKKNSKDC